VKGKNLVIGKYVLEHKVAKVIRSLSSKGRRKNRRNNINTTSLFTAECVMIKPAGSEGNNK